jgi:hypothetical protein
MNGEPGAFLALEIFLKKDKIELYGLKNWRQ